MIISNRRWFLVLILSFFAVLFFLFLFMFGKGQVRKVVTPTPSPISTPTPREITKYETLFYEDPDKSYQIVYSPSSQEYRIVILNSPFLRHRLLAENALLSQLKISREEACNLKVKVGTPYFANPAESGKEYPLSFCP